MGSVLGTIPGWLTLAALVGVAWIMVKGGTGTAVSGLTDANKELVRQVHNLKEENAQLKDRVAKLELQTNVSAAIDPLLQAMTIHETNAAERSHRTLLIMDQIAARLGPEPQ